MTIHGIDRMGFRKKKRTVSKEAKSFVNGSDLQHMEIRKGRSQRKRS